jgi:hypothetical protein
VIGMPVGCGVGRFVGVIVVRSPVGDWLVGKWVPWWVGEWVVWFVNNLMFGGMGSMGITSSVPPDRGSLTTGPRPPQLIVGFKSFVFTASRRGVDKSAIKS